MKKLITIIFVLALVSVGFSATIPKGKPNVDGNISEWTAGGVSGVEWHTMDQYYYGSPGVVPPDVSNGKYAAVWDDTTNLIYMAVQYNDANQYFHTTNTGWNKDDDIEIYVDAGNNNTNPYQGTYQDAQQWVIGPDGLGDGWAQLDALSPSVAHDLDDYAVTVSGTLVTYEVAIKPYSRWDGYGGTSPSILVDLGVGTEVGLDLIITSVYDAAGSFGMIADRPGQGSWFKASDLFQDHTLSGVETGIPEPATMMLLGLGGLALIRRKR